MQIRTNTKALHVTGRVAITGARRRSLAAWPGSAATPQAPSSLQLAENVFGPPDAKASPKWRREPFGPSFVLQTANEPEDEESTAWAGSFICAPASRLPKTQIGIIFKEQRRFGLS